MSDTNKLRDQLRREAQRHIGRATLEDEYPTVQLLLIAAVDALSAAERRAEIAERDAERYQLIRGVVTWDNSQQEVASIEFWNAFDHADSEEFDAAIDRALQQTHSEQSTTGQQSNATDDQARR